MSSTQPPINDNKTTTERASDKSSTTAIKAIEKLASDLDKVIDEDKSREDLIKSIRDQFLATRHASATKAEMARQVVLDKMMAQIEKLNVNQLFRLYQMLGESNSADISALFSNGPGGINILLNNNNGGPTGSVQNDVKISTDESGNRQNPVRASSDLLEGMQLMLTRITNEPNLIDQMNEVRKEVIDVDVIS